MTDLPRRPRRPAIFTLLAVLQFLFAAALFSLAVVLSFRIASTTPALRSRAGLLYVLVIAIAIVSGGLHVLCGIGLWRLKQYGWSLLRGWSALILLIIPIGTVIGILLLMYLNSPGVRVLYSEAPISILAPAELRDLITTTQSSAPMLTAAAVFALLGLFAAAGVVASIFMRNAPEFSPIRNEAQAIMTVERFAAAQSSYAAANGGRFGTPECLAAPAKCIPEFRGAIAFKDPPALAFERNGYVFQFFSPETIDVARARRDQADTRRLEKYAFLALPSARGRGLQRMFCVDGSGNVRATSARGKPPSVLPGECPEDWMVLRTIPAR